MWKDIYLPYGQENTITTRYYIGKNQEEEGLKVISRNPLIKNIQNGLWE